MKNIVFFFIAFLFSLSSFAQLELPKMFGDNMVLQRDILIPIWGQAHANVNIEVTINNSYFDCKTDAQGNWKVLLDSMPAGGPYTLNIYEKIPDSIISHIQYANVMIGDVWLASGQSNMELKVSESLGFSEEIALAKNSNIRFFQVEHSIQTTPQNDVAGGSWQLCDTSTVANFSAIAYYFSKQIQKEQGVAIGIIQSTWGGTPVTGWTSSESLSKIPEWKQKIEKNIADQINQDSFAVDTKNNELFYNIALNSYKGEELGFTKINYDESNWSITTLPKTYRGAENFEDILWFRQAVEILPSMQNQDLTINLGYPEILYSMYFNGHEICKNRWNSQKEHVYTIPAEFVELHENVITLRIAVMWGGGGIAEPADSMYITSGNKTVSLAANWIYIRNVETPFPTIKNYQKYPTYLYNGMINPLVPFALKGVLWYQGEEDAANPEGYSQLFTLMMQDWRTKWNQELPFIYVQLPNFMKRLNAPSESDWAVLRNEQLQSSLTENSAMVVTIDLGEADNIHPKNKQDVAYRMAMAANNLVYNKPTAFAGPRYKNYEINGNTIIVFFDNNNSLGLQGKGNDTITGFAIAGENKKFHWAQAKIVGNTVVVWSDNVPKPLYVRYAWADNPECNFNNKEGFPASPFKTDK